MVYNLVMSTSKTSPLFAGFLLVLLGGLATVGLLALLGVLA